jgi:6-phosphogluconolactonase (cycloisomerase 2 family)
LFVGTAGGNVTAYAIDPTTSALSATVPGVAAPGAVQAMTADSSGQYLIVGTNSGLVVYAYKSDGTLTQVNQQATIPASSYVSLTTATSVQ